MPGDVPSRFTVDFRGQDLGVYRVERELANGGMGAVYLATDTTLGRKVVVKVPHVRFLAEPEFRTRFAREIAELVRLEHPHVVRILARGVHDEVPYFVLQHLAGGSLEDRLERGPQTPEAVLAWLPAMARTLDFVHQRGVVHRDVKPANVLFDEEGHVYLSDFGVVKALEARESHVTLTGTGIGSPRYMAPEQGLGRPVDGRADQYALASTVYEALSGKPPFESPSPLEVMIQKENAPPPPLAERVPNLPRAAAGAVMRGLARDPDARFGTCAELAEAFAAGLRPAVAQPSRRGARAPGVWALALAALVAVLTGVGALAGWFRGGPAAPVAIDDDVVLRAEGDAPRRALRYRPAAGAEVPLVLTLVSAGQRRGPEPRALRATLVVSGRLAALERRADAAWRVRWTYDDVRVEREGPDVPDDGAALAALRGKGVEGTVTDRGLANLDLAALPEAAALERTVRENLRMLSGHLAVPLPEAPVGIGARWVATSSVQRFGIEIAQGTTYQLASLDERGAVVRVSVAEVAHPEQPVRFGAEPGAPEMRIERRSFEGRGDAALGFDRLAPTRHAMTFRLSVAATGTADTGAPVTHGVDMDIDFALESR
jgi:hypothetical protein